MARTDLEQLVFQMDANVVKMTRAMEKASGTVDAQSRKMQARLDKLGREAARAWEPVQRAAQVAFAGISFYAIKAAADAAETQNAFDVAFGKMSKNAQAFADVLANKVGRSVTDLQGGMSRMQLVLTGMGLSAQKALELTKALTERGIDIGSLWNVSDAEALQAIISGISGEAEPMKRFGAVINETAVKAELLRMGFKGNAQEASDAAKAIARANLILEKTTSAMGDAANTAGSTANQFKRAQGEFKDAAIALGTQLLPAVTDATKATADLAHEFGNLPASVQVGGLALLGLAAASGPIAKLIGSLIALVKYAAAARVALVGVAGAQALAVGAPAAIAAGGLAVGIGLRREKDYRATVRMPMTSSSDALASATKYAETNIRNLKAMPEANRPGRINERLTQFQTELGVLTAEVQRRTTFANSAGGNEIKTAQAEADAAMAALTKFGLDGVAAGGTGGSASRGGRKAKPDAPKLADPISGSTFIEDRPINTGPITDVMGGPVFDVTQFIEDLKKIVGLTGDAEKSIAEIQKRTEEGLIDPEMADAVISDLQRIDDEIMNLEETTRAWGKVLGQEIGRAIGDASAGFEDLGDAFGNILRRMLADMVASGFQDMMRSLFSMVPGKGGGFLTMAARGVGKFLGFAGGTNSAPGGLALVGEKGPELMNVPRGAQVIPNDILRSMASARGGMSRAAGRQAPTTINAHLTMDLTGANGDQTIRRIAAQAGRQAFATAVAASNKGLPAAQQRLNLLGTTG